MPVFSTKHRNIKVRPHQSFSRLAAYSCTATVLLISLICVHTASAAGTYLVNEKFNGMTTNVAPGAGWTSMAANGSVQVREYPFAADKSVRIERTATGTGESSLSRTFAN